MPYFSANMHQRNWLESWKLLLAFYQLQRTACHTPYAVHWRRKDTRSCPDILSCWLLQQYTLRHVCSSLASAPVSVEWGSATNRRKAQATTTSQTPCVMTFTGCWCDNAFSASWDCSSAFVACRLHLASPLALCLWASMPFLQTLLVTASTPKPKSDCETPPISQTNDNLQVASEKMLE